MVPEATGEFIKMGNPTAACLAHDDDGRRVQFIS